MGVLVDIDSFVLDMFSSEKITKTKEDTLLGYDDEGVTLKDRECMHKMLKILYDFEYIFLHCTFLFYFYGFMPTLIDVIIYTTG